MKMNYVLKYYGMCFFLCNVYTFGLVLVVWASYANFDLLVFCFGDVWAALPVLFVVVFNSSPLRHFYL